MTSSKEPAPKPPKRGSLIHKNSTALSKLALSYPEAWEDFPWGHSAFKVRKKAFIFMSATAESFNFSLKLPESKFEALLLPFTEPTGYGLGKSGWVSAKFGPKDRPPMALIEEWIDESYRAIAPKTLIKQLDSE